MKGLKVMLWGREVGVLSWNDVAKTTFFTFNPKYVANGLEIAPLTAKKGLLPVYAEENPKFQGLPAFIADSLPDSWGHELFERWYRGRRRRSSDSIVLDKLAFIGKRGMGALEFIPEFERRHVSSSIDIDSLYELAKKILSEREKAIITPDEEPTMESLIQVGSSIGGRFAKAIIAIKESTGEIRSGQIDGLTGFRYYIVKFNNPERSTAEIEMTYMQMATEAGITTMPSQLRLVEGIRHFFTERFDRPGGEKLHVLTLAAMNPSALSYEDLIAVCRQLNLPEREIAEVYRRMVFNVLSNNTDDHSRNISFTMDKEGRWHLSPAYDLTFIFDGGGFTPNREHCLMIRGKRRDFTKDDLLNFAKDAGIRSPETILGEVAASLKMFEEKAEANGVKKVWQRRITDAIIGNLKSFGLIGTEDAKNGTIILADGTVVTDIRIETSYKGNYHVFFTIAGNKYKGVVTPKNPPYDMIMNKGINSLTTEDLNKIIEQLRHM